MKTDRDSDKVVLNFDLLAPAGFGEIIGGSVREDDYDLLTNRIAEDGLNFEMVSYLNDIPPAGGAYIPDLFDDNKDGMGFKWGVCHYSDARYPDFLVRFDCDLMRNEEKSFAGAYNTYAKAMPVALRIDDYIPIDIKKRLDEERTNE